jgi:sugar lactone lactonase YvrE
VTVDSSDVYWTNVDDDTIKRAGLTGGAPETVASQQSVPSGIASDAAGVYWLNYGDGSVMRLGASQTPELVANGPRNGLAVASDGATLFWITEGNFGLLASAPETGAAGATTLQRDLFSPRDVAVDATHVYFTLNGAGEIHRTPKGGGNNELLIPNQNDPIGIAVFGDQVYWCNRGSGSVRSLPIIGGTSSTALATGQDRPFAVAVDASGVYWVNYGDGTVMQLPPGSTTPRTLAQGLPTARDIALDGSRIYWITEGEQQNGGTVMMVAKPAN